MSTISKPVMVHQESNFIYRPAVKSEVLVSAPGPLQRSRLELSPPASAASGGRVRWDTDSHVVPAPNISLTKR